MGRLSNAEKEKRERLQALAIVAGEIEGFEQGREVLTPVRSVRTIFPQFDVATRVNGFPIQRVFMVHGPSNEGKAQPLSAKVLTPTGWMRMGDIKPGDRVIGSDGQPTEVQGVFPQGKRQVYEVVTRDGRTRCCDEHLWFTTTTRELDRGRYVRGPRPERTRISTGGVGTGSVKSLAEIRDTLGAGHVLPRLSGPAFFESQGHVSFDPYVLGLLLGDGCFRQGRVSFTSDDKMCRDMVVEVVGVKDQVRLQDDGERTATVHIVSTRGSGNSRERSATWRFIEEVGLAEALSDRKFIPHVYRMGPPVVREEILRGLLDSDGCVTQHGTEAEYVTVSPRLAEDVAFVVRSLGGHVAVSEKQPHYTTDEGRVYGKPAWRLKITFDNGWCPFRLPRKADAWKADRKQYRNRIEQIIEVGEEECQCILVDADDHLYVTDDFLVTHNTLFAFGLGKSFLAGEHFYFHVDAEFSTPLPWVVENLRECANYPTFQALRPRNYEEVAEMIRRACDRLVLAKKKNVIPEHTSALFVIDSIQKLVPKDFLTKIRKTPAKGGGGVDPMAGRGGQIQAGFHSAWMKELVPMMHYANAGIVLISRESENVGGGMFDKSYKVGGGTSPYYDSSMVARVTRASSPHGWTTMGSGDNTQIIGEKHLVQIVKTKVGHKDDKTTRCYFHTSNGVHIPAGFDMARDVIEMGLGCGVLEKDDGHKVIDLSNGQVYGKTHAAVKLLTDDADMLNDLRDRCMTKAEPDEENLAEAE